MEVFSKIFLDFWPFWVAIIILGVIKQISEGRFSAGFSKQGIGQTKQSRLLWAALKERGIDGQTEYWDGHKHVDIAILPAKLYIEVDGIQHFRNLNQAIADLKRDDYSDQGGFRTIRISNDVIRQDVNMVADEIARQARERQIKK